MSGNDITHCNIAHGFKVCKKCGEELPATAAYFHRNKNSPDGLNKICKECNNAAGRNYARLTDKDGVDFNERLAAMSEALSSPVTTYRLSDMTEEERAALEARIEAKYGKRRYLPEFNKETLGRGIRLKMTTEELLIAKGLKGKISVAMVESVNKEEFVAMLQSGATNADLQKRFKMSSSYVYALRKLWDCLGDRSGGRQKKAEGKQAEGEQAALATTKPAAVPTVIQQDDAITFNGVPIVSVPGRVERLETLKCAELVEPVLAALSPVLADSETREKETIATLTLTNRAQVVAPLIVGFANTLIEMVNDTVTVEIRVSRG